MVFDSVREELALKISPIAKLSVSEIQEKPIVSVNQILPSPKIESPANIKQLSAVEVCVPPVENSIVTEIAEPAVTARQIDTAELIVKPTSKTLTDFNHKNSALPEWRLQMQNAVVKRRGGRESREETVKPHVVAATPTTVRAKSLVTSGATALKFQPEEKPATVGSADLSPLERALSRIERSRQKYAATEKTEQPQTAVQSSIKYFPQPAPNRTPEVFQRIEQPQTSSSFVAKANIASIDDLRVEKKFDTNKLAPIPEEISSRFENRPVKHITLDDYEDEEFIKNTIDDSAEVVAYAEAATVEAPNEEDIDDCAPLGMRFNAAIFDLLIGSFASLVLLSPFMLLSESFFSSTGFLAFLATTAVVMFAYMTLTIGFLGRTFGMKMFSLEIVDIDENAYPTVHQAAVSSCVYLVSLALGGLGFLTLFINNEKRAAHDLLSGTIIVKEY